MAKRSPYSSGKALKKQRNERMVKVGVGSALFFVLLIGFSLLLRLESITISSLTFNGLTTLTEAEVRPLVERQLAGAYAFFIPKSNAFIYPRGSIEKDLASTFTRIKSVEVSRESLTSVAVSIEERKPNAQWCKDERCYFLDEDGYIFAESPTYSGDVYLRYGGFIEVENPVGIQYLTPEEFRTLELFIISMKRIGFEVVSLTLKEDEFFLGIRGGGAVIFVRGAPLEQILEASETALQSDAFREKDLAMLEYLDLRFPNKAVYKWK